MRIFFCKQIQQKMQLDQHAILPYKALSHILPCLIFHNRHGVHVKGIIFFFHFFFLKLFIYLFIYFWLCWVFASVRGLPLVAASGGHSSSRCTGLSPSRPLLFWSTDSRRAGSVVVAHGPCCSAARGIFPDQGSNPCPLHWQADSQPLRRQGSPRGLLFLPVSVETEAPVKQFLKSHTAG